MKAGPARNVFWRFKLFDKHHDIPFTLVGIIFAIVLGGLGYMAGLQYNHYVSGQSARRVTEAMEVMGRHNDALLALQTAEASIAALKAEGIDVSSLEDELVGLKKAFSDKNYDGMSAYYDPIVSESARLRDEDGISDSSYSASLVNLQLKIEDYKKQGVNTATVSAQIATASAFLEEKQYNTVRDSIIRLSKSLDVMLAVKKEADRKAAQAAVVSVAAPVAAQSSGGVTYERKVVNTARGGFSSDILTVDMNRAKVKTFTANESDCAADCPLKPLASYVAENGGIAGINGTYFCPADYAQCGTTKNSFNFLVFDYRTKKYLNSSQNQYSVNPLMSFYNGSANYYTQALGYGRDTSANGVISNYPTLVHNGGVSAADGGGKGVRCGLGYRGSTLWAACVRSATLGEAAYVFQSLGATHAMNLDGGGSAALYFNGYRMGPGRNLPNAVVFTN